MWYKILIVHKRPVKEYLEWLLLATSIVVIISGLRQARASFWPSQIGSFEYVRKGEYLLDKGNFRESIKYFEKAYESSPENNTIISELIDAYFKYASYFVESKDYKNAIDYLTKAYNVRPGSSTIQNLAIMYSEKAVSEVHSDLAAAKADFKNARDIAASSAIASKNLSTTLFNEAVTAFKSGNDGLAITFLKEASLAYKNNPTLKLLGDIYYRRTELERARLYFGKALAMDPHDAAAREKLQKITKELRLAKTEELKDFEHFEMRCDKGLPVDANILKGSLERCYLDVGKDFKYFPDSKTIIFIYSQDDFKNVFKLPSGVRAFYDGNIRIPLPGRVLSEGELSRYIYHEYTHAVISALTDNNCPVWLNEGLAMWEEYKDRDDAVFLLFSRFVNEKQVSLNSLYSAFNPDGNAEKEPRTDYLLAYSMVKYIIDNWGIEGMRNLLARIKDGRHFVNAVDDEFLLSEKELESRWKNYVIKRYLRPLF